MKQIEPFVPVPRYVSKDVAKGELTYGEYELYIWMRLKADIYGVATVSVGGLLDDLPHFKSEDNLSKFLRSLRSKKYVEYPKRQGHRGSFEVRFYDWLYEKKEIRPSGRRLEEDALRSSGVTSPISESEVDEKLSPQTPKSKDEVGRNFNSQNQESPTAKLRSENNDTDTQKDKNTDESSNRTFKRVATLGYEPKGDAERRCKEIAIKVGEPYLNFIFSVLKDSDGGIEVIEQGFEQFLLAMRKYENEGKRVENPPALFNTCVKAAIEDKRYENELKEETL